MRYFARLRVKRSLPRPFLVEPVIVRSHRKVDRDNWSLERGRQSNQEIDTGWLETRFQYKSSGNNSSNRVTNDYTRFETRSIQFLNPSNDLYKIQNLIPEKLTDDSCHLFIEVNCKEVQSSLFTSLFKHLMSNGCHGANLFERPCISRNKDHWVPCEFARRQGYRMSSFSINKKFVRRKSVID